MGSPPRLCVYAVDGDPGAIRLGRLLAAPVVTKGRSVVRMRPEVALVRLPVARLANATLITTIAGVSAAIAVPIGPPAALGWWGRRFHRFLLPSQDEARAWGASGVALGRLVIVDEVDDTAAIEALRAVLGEVRAMALRPDIRPRAR